MADYRRNFVQGGSYFFTVNLADRRSTLLVDRIVELREIVRQVHRQKPFRIDAWVVLPEHMHCIWTLPEGDIDYPGRWRAIKKAFSKSVPAPVGIGRYARRSREREVWQRRYWEHTIVNDADYAVHIDYVHRNPVKHGLVERVQDWPYSTFHRYVEQGIYDIDWHGG
jgi:putative transposase